MSPLGPCDLSSTAAIAARSSESRASDSTCSGGTTSLAQHWLAQLWKDASTDACCALVEATHIQLPGHRSGRTHKSIARATQDRRGGRQRGSPAASPPHAHPCVVGNVLCTAHAHDGVHRPAVALLHHPAQRHVCHRHTVLARHLRSRTRSPAPSAGPARLPSCPRSTECARPLRRPGRPTACP